MKTFKVTMVYAIAAENKADALETILKLSKNAGMHLLFQSVMEYATPKTQGWMSELKKQLAI